MLNIKLASLKKMRALIFCGCLFSSAAALSEGIDAEFYTDLDLAARQATLDGVHHRLLLLRNSVDLAVQIEQGNHTQQIVEMIYRDAGVTSSQVIAWSTRHSNEVADWLATHPQLQAEYDRIESELSELSTQIRLLIEN